MIRISRFAALLAASVAFGACKPSTEAPDAAESPAAVTQGAEEPAPTLALLDACKIKMTQPEAHEWQTKWQPAHAGLLGQYPSGVRSAHWADQAELKLPRELNIANPFYLVCGSEDRGKPTILFTISAEESTTVEVPLQPATYTIAREASGGNNKPGEFIVGAMMFDDSLFRATSGTLTLERFDMRGVAGSFVIDGKETMGSRPIHMEGTFDMPCLKAMRQSGCQSGKAE